jgi:hypothetical protein
METSVAEVVTSFSKIKPSSQDNRITNATAASRSRVLYEVECDGMEIDN